jgi:hypothetical protein
MVLSGLFHLYELVQACTSLYKLKKVSCKFTDDWALQRRGVPFRSEPRGSEVTIPVTRRIPNTHTVLEYYLDSLKPLNNS